MALFSLEMSESELAQRFVASQASIKGDDLRKGRLKDERKWKRVLECAGALDQAPLFIDDSSDISMLEIRAKARRLHQPAPLGMIIVDYLQLLRPDGRTDNRVEQVGQMSRGLKILARELEVPVIALSQLSRGVESRNDKRPLLVDLRESGQIEQDADLVMFIYRDEYYNRETTDALGEAELIIAKHRNGVPRDGRDDVPGRVPALPRPRPARRRTDHGRLPLRPLRRQRLRRRRARTRVATPCRCRPQRVARGRTRRCPASSRASTAASRSTGRPSPRSPTSPPRRCARSRPSCATSRPTWTPAAGSGCTAASGRARRPSRCWSPRPRWTPGAPWRSTRCRGCSPRSATTFDDDNDRTYTSLLDRLAEVDLLHVDDVGAEKTSEWVLEQLYAIINARYEEERSVLITTNLERDALAEQITERTVSRLEEMCEVLPLWGTDARRQSA